MIYLSTLLSHSLFELFNLLLKLIFFWLKLNNLLTVKFIPREYLLIKSFSLLLRICCKIHILCKLLLCQIHCGIHVWNKLFSNFCFFLFYFLNIFCLLFSTNSLLFLFLFYFVNWRWFFVLLWSLSFLWWYRFSLLMFWECINFV